MEISENVRELVACRIRLKEKFIAGETYIPVAKAIYDDREVEAVVQAALDFRIVDGELSHEFEREMARFMQVRHATFCNSGSSANLLAFNAIMSPKLGSKALKPGDEVITCAVGFPTTVAPIIQAGCIPVYVDATVGNYNPTPFMVEDAITDKTRAIFLAHTLGNPFDVKAIKDIADRNELWLIEDCADAIGGEFDGKKLGTFGNLSTASFYPAHMMTTGEGGMVFTDSPMLNQIVRSLRDWGRDCWCAPAKDNTCGKRFCQSQKVRGELPEGYDHKYVYSHVGFNLKSTDLQAAIGLEQLKKLPQFIEMRRNNWEMMSNKMMDAELDKYFILPHHYSLANPSPFGFLLTVKENAKFSRNELTQYLEEHKIGTRNLFAGNLTKHPGFLGKGRVADTIPKADFIMGHTFWIGCHPGINIDMIEYIVDTLLEFVESKNDKRI